MFYTSSFTAVIDGDVTSTITQLNVNLTFRNRDTGYPVYYI